MQNWSQEGKYFGTADAVCVHGYLPFESEMREYLVYVLIVKYFLILFKFSHNILDWEALS